MKYFAVALVAVLGISFSEDITYNRFFLVDRVFLMPFVLKYSDELGLDSEQLERIKGFVKENEKEIRRNVKILRYLEKKAKLMILNAEKEREVREVLADIASVKLEMSLLNAKSVKFLKETLTPEQFSKLKDIALVRFLELQQ